MRLTIRDVQDRADILDCLMRCLQGQDQRDWPMFEDAFAPLAVIEMPLFLPAPLSPTQFRKMLQQDIDPDRLSGQHFLGNTHIEIRDDGARCVTEFAAMNSARCVEIGTSTREEMTGIYIDHMACGDGQWRIMRHVIALKSREVSTIA